MILQSATRIGNVPLPLAAPQPPVSGGRDDAAVRQAFDQFVDQTFYGMMLKSMRASLGEPAYFHGGRAEEVFQQQLDQTLVEKLSAADGDRLSGDMFPLLNLGRP